MRQDARKYLDPAVLSKLGNMELVARCAVEGFFSGVHPSPFHGFSVEYSDHRAYQPGDELKFLDWKLFGRTDKLHIKQFHQETNASACILLDASSSMGFAGNGSVSKFEYGCFLAAALAYLLLKQGDRVGLALFGEDLTAYVPASSRTTHLHALLSALRAARPAGRTDMGAVLQKVAEMTTRRGIFVLISDLIDDVDEVFRGLACLRHEHHDALLLHTLDHRELHLDYDGLVEFRDMESDARVRTFPQSVRATYRGRLDEFLDGVKRTAGMSGIDYCLLDTSEPLDRALTAFLARRRSMM